MEKTIIQKIGTVFDNELYVKREDLIPFSFGGNKVRKAIGFFKEIDGGDYDSVVTYGSSSSNHCRAVANMAVARGMKCYIISPEEASEETFNSQMMRLFDAEITVVPVNKVSESIDDILKKLRSRGQKPYFIAGGGHGNIGTAAYVDCYTEIKDYEKQCGLSFDYIFHASGTGTTQAGLVCGMLLNSDNKKIIGISVARKNPRGRDVVLSSVKEYLETQKIEIDEKITDKSVIFDDGYISGGYGHSNPEIDTLVEECIKKYGIPLDTTYTGKAFYGMQQYLANGNISQKNILFVHTGGTPLFFEYLKKDEEAVL